MLGQLQKCRGKIKLVERVYPSPRQVQEAFWGRRCGVGFLLLRGNTKSYGEREETANMFDGGR